VHLFLRDSFTFLFALGFVPLALRGVAIAALDGICYDAALLLTAVIDARLSRLPAGVAYQELLAARLAVGAETEVQIRFRNSSTHPVSLNHQG